CESPAASSTTPHASVEITALLFHGMPLYVLSTLWPKTTDLEKPNRLSSIDLGCMFFPSILRVEEHPCISFHEILGYAPKCITGIFLLMAHINRPGDRVGRFRMMMIAII
ncbi:hypothetical protein ACJX0J_025181, partial [Zea mays]